MHAKNCIREVTAGFFNFSIANQHLNSTFSLSAWQAAKWPHLISSNKLRLMHIKEAEKSALNPLDRVPVPGDVSKKLKQLLKGIAKKSLVCHRVLFSIQPKRFPGPPAASQELRERFWEQGWSITQNQNKVVDDCFRAESDLIPQ